ncbi:MAG: hypothetical protein IEMM0008_1269 [bacterium]|nr:MAG: hypothetical protein IEMM0008_1269 [bacterium]
MGDIKKWIIVLLLCLSWTISLNAYEWDKGFKKFTLGMTISEVEAILLEYKPDLKAAPEYFSRNYYFVRHDHPRMKKLYVNNNDVLIEQTSDPKRNYVEGQVILKKVFGYKIGLKPMLDGTKVFSDVDKWTPGFFKPRPVYHYRYFPVQKINPLLESIELTFYDERLFRIVVKVKKTDKKISMSPRVFHLKYIHETLNRKYESYLQKVKRKVEYLFMLEMEEIEFAIESLRIGSRDSF